MRKFFLTAAAVFLTGIFCTAGFSATVDVIQLEDDTINPVTAEYILNAIARAEASGAQCLIIRLDTPGGLLNSTRTIVKAIMAAQVPVVVYIAPGGSRAGSAGVFMTYAAHVAAMAPSTNIGAAHPVQMGQRDERTNMWDALKELVKAKKTENGETGEENPAADEGETADARPMESKILNDTVAFIKSIAEQRGRNVDWAVQSVVKSESITEQDALVKGVIEIIAVDNADLLRQLDGRVVMAGSEERVLATRDARIRTVPMTGRQKLFNILANPNVAYILMILGFYGLLYEVTNPGIGVPGIAGTIFLILAFFSMQTLPTNYAGLALVVLGLMLFAAEAMVPGFGLLTLGGLVSLVLGSLLLFDSSVPVMRVSLSVVLPFALATAGMTVFLVRAVVRAHHRRAVSGKEGLVGAVGTARQAIAAGVEGKVFVHGEIWNAAAEDDIAQGDRVVVVKVDGLMLTVKKQS